MNTKVSVPIIFLPTVPHTGTNFAISLLVHGYQQDQRAIPPNTYFAHARVGGAEEYMLLDSQGKSRACCFRSFVYLITDNVRRFVDKQACSFHIGVVQTHLGFYVADTLPDLFVRGLMGEFKTIIPLRDPLVALLTAEARRPGIDHSHIISAFSFVPELTPCDYLPVDLWGQISAEDRKQKLLKLFEYLEISVPDRSTFWDDIWQTWTAVGTTEEGSVISTEQKAHAKELKKYYQERDLKRIKEAIPKEYAYLKCIESKLRPFLEEVGYTDLLWWD